MRLMRLGTPQCNLSSTTHLYPSLKRLSDSITLPHLNIFKTFRHPWDKVPNLNLASKTVSHPVFKFVHHFFLLIHTCFRFFRCAMIIPKLGPLLVLFLFPGTLLSPSTSTFPLLFLFLLLPPFIFFISFKSHLTSKWPFWTQFNSHLLREGFLPQLLKQP